MHRPVGGSPHELFGRFRMERLGNMPEKERHGTAFTLIAAPGGVIGPVILLPGRLVKDGDPAFIEFGAEILVEPDVEILYTLCYRVILINAVDFDRLYRAVHEGLFHPEQFHVLFALRVPDRTVHRQ